MDVLAEGLSDLGVLPRPPPRGAAAAAAVHPFCPHLLGHWLGMDVHDAGRVPQSRPLQPGVVITIEPGLYFGAGDARVPPHLRGIGVRIEDDVVIVEGGARVLSEGAPTAAEDVERAVLGG